MSFYRQHIQATPGKDLIQNNKNLNYEKGLRKK